MHVQSTGNPDPASSKSLTKVCLPLQNPGKTPQQRIFPKQAARKGLPVAAFRRRLFSAKIIVFFGYSRQFLLQSVPAKKRKKAHFFVSNIYHSAYAPCLFICHRQKPHTSAPTCRFSLAPRRFLCYTWYTYQAKLERGCPP